MARPARLMRAEPTDDGEVEQQVDGFGGQHSERGQRQPGDAPAGRGRDRQIGVPGSAKG